MTTSQSLMTVNNQSLLNNNNNNNSTTISEFKHCECKNAKELIQLIRSDAIESVQLSWPDDMGLWYSSLIKSCEVSLQNLVEGIKLQGQLLFVDPTSARFDLSKKQKSILVRCSLNVNNNKDNSISSNTTTNNSNTTNNNNNNNNNTNTSIRSSISNYSSYYEDSGDGEVARSPPSKFSLLLDESEKSRKIIQPSNPFASLGLSPPPVVYVTPPSLTTTSLLSSLSLGSSNNNGPGGPLLSPNLLDGYLPNSPPSTPSSTPTSPSMKGSVPGGLGTGYQSLKKTQSIQPPKNSNNLLNQSSGGLIINITTNSNVNSSASTPQLSTSYKDSVLGKRALEDPDSTWLEEIRNGSTVEIVPDLTNPLLSLSSSTGIINNSSPLNSSDSSPGLPNNDDSSSGETDLTNIDSAERAILEGQIHLPPLLRPRQYHACKIPKEDRPNKRRKNHTSLFCRHCGTTDTPEWRRGPDGRKSLCNACGLHYSKLVKKENMAVPQLSRSFEISVLLNPSD